MAGLLNAFSSGFLEGARGGALIDATWAAQDAREQAAKDKLRLEADMQEFADLSEKNSGAVMASPEGQQVAGRILMGNPEVRQAINSNVGHEYAGVVKNPKKEDEYFLTVRNPDGAIRPVTVNRETGGIPVAYTGQQLVNMAASSLAAEGADTPEFRQKMGLPAEGDVYQAMATRYPSMGTAEQIRAAATQGKDFIANGGVPAAKQGTAGVKAAVNAMKSPVEEEEEEEEVTESPAAEFVPTGQGFAEANLDRMLAKKPVEHRELTSDLVPTGQSFAEANLDRMLSSPPEKSQKEVKEELIANRTPFGRLGEFTTDMMKDSGSDQSSPVGSGERTAPKFDAYDVGQFVRRSVGATVDNLRQNVVEPVAEVTSGIKSSADNFMAALKGEERVPETTPVSESETPSAKPEASTTATLSKPRDAADVAVEKQRVPAKVFNNSVHVEKLDKAIGSQVAKEPLNERVTKDGEALDRLSKLASGRKPNSRELYLAMRLVKSGILTADQLGKFRETGKLDNVEFDNAYKEQSVRQNWTQLDLAKQRLSFDQFKETMDQQRHMQNQSIQRLKLGFEATKEGAKYADKKATKVYNGVHDVLTADFMGRMQQNPEFKDASAGDVKFFAEAAATRLLNNPTYVQSVLGRDISDIGDAEHLRAGIKEIMPVIRGEGFWSKGSNIPLKTDFKHDPQKVLKGAQ